MLNNNDQELKRLGMAGMTTANKKFDSFFVRDLSKSTIAKDYEAEMSCNSPMLM